MSDMSKVDYLKKAKELRRDICVTLTKGQIFSGIILDVSSDGTVYGRGACFASLDNEVEAVHVFNVDDVYIISSREGLN